MGLPTGLFKWIQKTFPKAFEKKHPVCDVVVGDVNTDFHPLVQSPALARPLRAVQIYNLWFRRYREDFKRDVKEIILTMDTGVPVLKKETTEGRGLDRSASDARKQAAAEMAAAVDPDSAAAAAATDAKKPAYYHADSYFLPTGELVEPSAGPAPPTKHREILMSRLFHQRSLRQKFYEWCVAYPMRAEKLPPGTMLWVDHTPNRKLGPVCYSADEEPGCPHVEQVSVCFGNDWLEADWKIPFWLHMRMDYYRAAIVYSVDGDLLPILVWFYYSAWKRRLRMPPSEQRALPAFPSIYWYNGRAEPGVVNIGQLCLDISTKWGPIPLFLLLTGLCGTDYCEKSHMTKGIGEEKLAKALVSGDKQHMFDTDAKATSIDDKDVPPMAPAYIKSRTGFTQLIDRLYMLSRVKQPIMGPELMEQARVRLCAGWLAWDLCWQKQSSTNRWLRPIGTADNAAPAAAAAPARAAVPVIDLSEALAGDDIEDSDAAAAAPVVVTDEDMIAVG